MNIGIVTYVEINLKGEEKWVFILKNDICTKSNILAKNAQESLGELFFSLHDT